MLRTSPAVASVVLVVALFVSGCGASSPEDGSERASTTPTTSTGATSPPTTSTTPATASKRKTTTKRPGSRTATTPRSAKPSGTSSKASPSKPTTTPSKAKTTPGKAKTTPGKGTTTTPAPASKPKQSSGKLGRPRTYAGTGDKELGALRFERNVVVRWTVDGGGKFAVTDAGGKLKISGSGASGQTFAASGSYRSVKVAAGGRWTLSFTALGA